MAFPDGVSTCTLTAGSALMMAGGEPLPLTLTVTPVYGVVGTDSITHAASGQPLLAFAKTVTVEAGMVAQVVVPHVDQSGFINGAGDAYTMWSYRCEIIPSGPTGKTKVVKNVQPLVGQSNIDLDNLPDGSITSPTSAPTATVTSVVNETGAVSKAVLVTAGLLDDDAAAALVGDADTATGAALFDRVGRVYTPEMFGAVGDGSTDDTTAIMAADAAARSAGGGTVKFDAKTYRCDGALSPAYTGTSAPKQKPCTWEGTGPTFNGYWPASGFVNGGTVLDLRYDGTDTLHPAKIDTRGAGRWEITGITFVSGGSDDYPFMQTTNTTVDVHGCAFSGNPAHSGASCAQDAIVLGGTTEADVATDEATAPFQGYGSRIAHNFFDRIRVCVKWDTYANAVNVHENTISLTCGSSDEQGAPFVLHPTAAGITGNTLAFNLIEQNYYAYYAAVLGEAHMNSFVCNNSYDAGDVAVGGIYFYSNTLADDNLIIMGSLDGDLQAKIADGPGATRQTIITWGGAAPTTFPYKVTFYNDNGPTKFRMGVGSATLRGVDLAESTTGRAVIFRDVNGDVGAFFENDGKHWKCDGVGDGMSQDSGTGGSYFDHHNYGVRFYDHNSGPLRAVIGAGTDGIKLGSASDATIKRVAAGVIDVGKLAVENAAAATTPGTVVKKVEIFDAAGASLGFIPVYSTIT